MISIASSESQETKKIDDLIANSQIEWDSSFQLTKVIKKMIKFTLGLNTNVELYPYQIDFLERIFQSVLLNDGQDLTALFARQMGKCLALNTPVMLSNGSTKYVQDLKKGDYVMGFNGIPRKIFATVSGKEAMYKVIPKIQGPCSYIVNESHILTLIEKTEFGEKIADIPIKYLIDNPDKIKKFKGFKNTIPFEEKPLTIDPFEAGVLFGEHINNLDYIKNLFDIDYYGIPEVYFKNTYSVKKEFLRGLIDTIGLLQGQNALIHLEDRSLAYNIQSFVETMGIRTYLNDFDFVSEFSTLCLKDIDEPILNMSYSFTIEPVGEDTYYGFAIDGEDKRFLLSDGTVTHNTETVASAISGLSILMPVLAKVYPKQLSMYSSGFMIGIFAPSSNQVSTMHARVEGILSKTNVNEILSNRDIKGKKEITKSSMKIYGDERFDSFGWVSIIDFASADKRSKLESKSYHLIVEDEAQEIDDTQALKSINPMGAAYNSSTIKIGTTGYNIGHFYNSIMKNRETEILKGIKSHYEYDYTVGMLYNKKYRKFVENEIEKRGDDTEEFKMAFKLQWFIEKGMAITIELIEEYMSDNKLDFEMIASENSEYVAGLDIGGVDDPSNLTILNVKKIDDGKPIVKIASWLEITNKTAPEQIAIIKSWVLAFGIKTLVIDSTGKGDPIAEYIEAELMNHHCSVFKYVFTPKSKHHLAVTFYDYLKQNCIRLPGTKIARNDPKYKKFIQQWTTAEKNYKGKYMQIEHPKGNNKAHDEFIDSLLLAIYGAEQTNLRKVTPDGISLIKKASSRTNAAHQAQRAFEKHKIKLASALYPKRTTSKYRPRF